MRKCLTEDVGKGPRPLAHLIREKMQPLHHGPSVQVFGEHSINSQFHNLENIYTGPSKIEVSCGIERADTISDSDENKWAKPQQEHEGKETETRVDMWQQRKRNFYYFIHSHFLLPLFVYFNLERRKKEEINNLHEYQF